ncbi:glycosyl hydrolase, family 1 [Dictyocaulus viviparus]|uniref:Glycosyl hydrolase, family 1 n=1 Tax=Dictyocaulus viviparus TaxID=29172 RepID=A0A0D8XNB9_DICVI|nr:glycosyl hydrolase, family 1 [Dictyocaulus viviparus]
MTASITRMKCSKFTGSLDFLGLNYYSTVVVRRFRGKEKDVRNAIGYDIDGTSYLSKEDMPVGGENSWLRSHPSGLRAVLNFIKDNYNNIEVFITENGCMDTPGEFLNDVTRIRYLREHIAAVSQDSHRSAIVDGCNVVGYTVWSLLDNFEWSAGYTTLFGIHKVDFTSPSRTRTPKESAKFYADVIRNNSVVLIEDCTWNNL